MIIVLYRPSPQIPQPTAQAALRCFASAAYVVNLSSQQVKKAAIDITWVFLLTVYMSLNTVLWAVSYPEVRAVHTREESEELINLALDIIDQCSERWPGTSAASQLYDVLAKACLQSFEVKEESPQTPAANGTFYTPPTQTDSSFPSASQTSTPTSTSTVVPTQQQDTQPRPAFNPPQFGHVFNSTPEQMSVAFDFDPELHPTFRSDSIFRSPATESHGRRFSHFPPDFDQLDQSLMAKRPGESMPLAPGTAYNSQRSPPLQSPFTTGTSSSIMTTVASTMPTPPDSSAPQIEPGTRSLSPTPSAIKMESADPTPTLSYATPTTSTSQPIPVSVQSAKYEPDQQHPNHQGQIPPRTAAFTIPGPPQPNPSARQRPLPATTITDWFSPPPPFISPYAFSSAMDAGYWGGGDNNVIDSAAAAAAPFSGLGLADADAYSLSSGGRAGQAAGVNGGAGGFAGGFHDAGGAQQQLQYVFPPERNGSLSVEQQTELMDVLETEGMNEIDAFLSAEMSRGGGGVDGNASWG